MVQVVLGPVLVAIGVFVWAGLVHLMLLGLGAGRGGFGGTFGVACYSQAFAIFSLIPFCGTLLALPYLLVLSVVGLAAVHGIGEARGYMAIVLAIVLTCCCLLGAVVVLGSLAGWRALATSHSPDPGGDRGQSPAPLRLGAAHAPPLGAIFAGIGLLLAAAVGLLRLDRIPVTLCVFKGLTGLPCPTCGSTRALGRLFALDFAGAVAMNPLTTLAAILVSAWALADLALMSRGRALSLEVGKPLGFALRVTVFVLFLANWAYLVAAGR